MPRRVQAVVDELAHVQAMADDLPSIDERQTDLDLAAAVLASGDPVATILADDEAQRRRDAVRRAREVLTTRLHHLNASVLNIAVKASADELLTIASDAAAQLLDDARPHAEALSRFAARGYVHEDVLRHGDPHEVDAAQQLERMVPAFTLALTLWMMTARTVLRSARFRTANLRPDLSGPVAWRAPELVERELRDDPERVRLVVAAVSPGGFDLPRTLAELAARQDVAVCA